MSKREKTLLSILLIIVISYVYYHFLFAPIRSDISTISQENKDLKASIKMVEQKLGEPGSANKESAQIKEDYKQLASRLPAQPCIPEVIVYLENIAVESGMSLVAVDYRREDNLGSSQGSGQPDGLMTATFDLMLQGDYDSLQGFITKLEKESPRIYNIRRVNIMATSGGATESYDPNSSSSYDASHLMVDMKMAAYYDNIFLSDGDNLPSKVAPGEGRANPFVK